MRNRSSSMHNNNMSKLKEEPQLSGAYIRRLVKQLSSSRPKDPSSPPTPDSVLGENPSEPQPQTSPPPPPPPQPKKQVRRRLHTTRPYQERLLNMAEARREIVTALKLHRASMKQANEQQQQQQQENPSPPIPPQQSPPLVEDSHQEMMANHRIYQPISSNFPNYNQYQSQPPFTPFSAYPPLCWPYPPISPLPISDTLNLPLPNQTLGLNLNFQGFNNIDTTLCNNKTRELIQPQSSSSSSSSTSYSSPASTALEVTPRAPKANADPPIADFLHPAMDDEGMAEIRSVGEQHDIEWNDTMNLMASAWWSRFLKTMETGSEDRERAELGAFDEAMEWDSGVGYLLPQCFEDQHMEDYLQDASLPCLDIGELEGLDGDWLS